MQLTTAVVPLLPRAEPMKGRRMIDRFPNPAALVAGASGAVAAVAGSVAETSGNAVAVAPAASNVTWLGAAVAISSFAFQLYQQWRNAKRVADDADAAAMRVREDAEQAADLLRDTKEHETWGGKYDRELQLRNRAEARLEIVEAENGRLLLKVEAVEADNRKMVGIVLNLEEQVKILTASLGEYKAKQDKAGARQDKIVEAVKKTVKRVDEIEHPGSISNYELPVTPPPGTKLPPKVIE